MRQFRRAFLIVLCCSVIFSSVVPLSAGVVLPTPLINKDAFIQSGANRNMPDYHPPEAKRTYLVQDTFVDAKAQLKPIADYFLSQPWYYWAGQNLAGQKTKPFSVTFDLKFGDTWRSERARTGSMNSIKGLTDADGKALGASARIMDVLNSPQVQPGLLKAVQAAFPDITGDEWYASMVGWAVMMGVIGGKPNPSGEGLIFAGDDYLTRAEWIAMLNRCRGLENWLMIQEDPNASKPSSDGVVPPGTWFLADYNHSMVDEFPGMYRLDELSQPATRAEAAMMLEVGEGFAYAPEKHGYPKLTYDSLFDLREQFSDTRGMRIDQIMIDPLNTGTLSPSLSLKNYLDGLSIPQRIEAAKSSSKGFPYPIYRMLGINVNARVLGGFPDNTLRVYDPLTRAQALAILFKLYDLYPNSKFADPYDG